MPQRVSVVMATYNGEKYIKDQLESIFIQLPEDGEVIISDDGSTDKTIDIVKSFHHPKVNLLINGQHKGVAQNFENALVAASGDVIFLCDQDDLWHPNKVEVCLNHMKIYDLVVSDCRVIDKDNEIQFDSYFERRKSGAGLLKNLVANTYLGCCMVFNRKVLQMATPFPRNITMHDIWLGFVAELFFTSYFIKQPLVSYRTHENNVTPTSVGISKFGVMDRLSFRWNILKHFPLLVYRRFNNVSKRHNSLL